MTASDRLRAFVDSGDFDNLKMAWLEFLQHLAAETGSSLSDKQDPLVSAVDFVSDNGLEDRVQTLRWLWFYGYERRPEVLEALDRFLRQRGLG